MTVSAIIICRIVDGQIAEHRLVGDQLALLQPLGIVSGEDKARGHHSSSEIYELQR